MGRGTGKPVAAAAASLTTVDSDHDRYMGQATTRTKSEIQLKIGQMSPKKLSSHQPSPQTGPKSKLVPLYLVAEATLRKPSTVEASSSAVAAPIKLAAANSKPSPSEAIQKPSHSSEATPKPSTAEAFTKSSPSEATSKPSHSEATPKPSTAEAFTKSSSSEATSKPSHSEAPSKPSPSEALSKPSPSDVALQKPSSTEAITTIPASSAAPTPSKPASSVATSNKSSSAEAELLSILINIQGWAPSLFSKGGQTVRLLSAESSKAKRHLSAISHQQLNNT
eukprot:scaffold9090_cov76-Cyclotella_meneghiniana.AAC.6